jgi:hypothetical protein
VTSLKPYPANDEVLATLRGRLTSGVRPAELVAEMRAEGFGKIDSIKFLREFGGVTLGQAKDIVHLSPAWADRYESDEAFHDAAEAAFHQMLKEEESAAA